MGSSQFLQQEPSWPAEGASQQVIHKEMSTAFNAASSPFYPDRKVEGRKNQTKDNEKVGCQAE